MDSAQRTQEFGVAKSMAEIDALNACSRPQPQGARKERPKKDETINCPRCNSTNTKFCCYNNYSLAQPRYFCKTCRSYWTQVGNLRNVPAGGGLRINKNSLSSSSSSSSSSSPSLSMITPLVPSSNKLPDLNPPFSSLNPKTHDQQHDLNLGFHGGHVPQFLDQFPKIESTASSTNSSSSAAPLSALDFFRNGIAARGLTSFLPMAPKTLENDAIFASGFSFQECKPALLFPVEGVNGSSNAPQENVNGGLMFDLGASTRRNSSDQGAQDKGQENSNGFWNGMLGGGSR